MSLLRAVPALPVERIVAGVDFYCERLGFTVVASDDGFAKLVREGAEVHLWAAFDDDWRARSDFVSMPICSGAESFLAGTASCRIETDGLDELYREMAAAQVLHPGDAGAGPTDTEWGTREFAVVDLAGNLLTFFSPVVDGA
ncbi:glyoxalase/bleomycin resistance protein/dioxygenase superfamily protein [Williamsia limnetica]|uniref:Bleomycin resistance protein n=1 Tax=Williamsia limnetica TaxID=882452 RepID=A0A318RKW5_WILLI|nr:VOC family protein [Williamsia limnetica]PYE11820.1 glyoxalase/bleomycin resistance protein/dioxygenase superfamily protein [Williamsia limnetica]